MSITTYQAPVYVPGNLGSQNSDLVEETASVTPAQIVRSCLMDWGIVSYPGQQPLVLLCYAFSMPDAANEAVCVIDTSGVSFGKGMRSGKINIHPGVQIIVRHRDEVLGYLKMNEIKDGLDSHFPIATQVPEDGSVHRIANIRRTSPIITLGEEVGKRRYLWSLNAVVAFEYEEPSLG